MYVKCWHSAFLFLGKLLIASCCSWNVCVLILVRRFWWASQLLYSLVLINGFEISSWLFTFNLDFRKLIAHLELRALISYSMSVADDLDMKIWSFEFHRCSRSCHGSVKCATVLRTAGIWYFFLRLWSSERGQLILLWILLRAAKWRNDVLSHGKDYQIFLLPSWFWD